MTSHADEHVHVGAAPRRGASSTAPEEGAAPDTPGSRQAGGGVDRAADLARLLPELAVALYQAAPHDVHGRRGPDAPGEPLTGRQMEAVVFLAHRGRVTMGEFADGLEISRAAASELVARLVERQVVRREADAGDRRLVHVGLAGRAEGYVEGMLAQWREQLAAVFARHPAIEPDALVAFLRDVFRELKGRPPR